MPFKTAYEKLCGAIRQINIQVDSQDAVQNRTNLKNMQRPLNMFNTESQRIKTIIESQNELEKRQEQKKEVEFDQLQNDMNTETDKLIKYNNIYYNMNQYMVNLLNKKFTELLELHNTYVSKIFELQIAPERQDGFANSYKYLKYKTKYLALS